MQEKMNKSDELSKKGRTFRNFASFEVRSGGGDGGELYVEGIACPFNRETVICCYGDVEYKEKVDVAAFAGADMTDVIFNYNHGGKVMARTRNKTLELSLQSDGLHMRARLDGTEEGRELYEEIRGGYIDRMSYAYTVDEDSYDCTTHTRTVLKIGKLYDVSAVDIPAYESTNISARGMIDAEKTALAIIEKLEQRKKRLMLLTEL